jgi:hypothetical protein
LRGFPRISSQTGRADVTEPHLPTGVRDLIHGPVATIAHLELLLALWRCRPGALLLAAVADEARVTSLDGARSCLDDLVAAGLLAPTDDGWRFAPSDPSASVCVDELATMYTQRPVTLVRALYARPSRPSWSVGDLFRRR